jgi:apolipoprotein D and lipocalin family protein
MKSTPDAGEPTLAARIRAAEDAVARRDAAFLREFDTFAAEVRQTGRRGAGLLAAGGAVAAALLLLGARGRSSEAKARERDEHDARDDDGSDDSDHRDDGHAGLRSRPRRQRHGHGAGWLGALSLLLPIVAPFLPPHLSGLLPRSRSGSRGARAAGLVGLIVPTVQWLRQHWPRPGLLSDLHVAAHVDLRRYAGDWYEFARLPSAPESPCVGNVSAHYRLLRDGTLEVENRCVDRTGREQVVHGVGKPLPGGGASQLVVTFAPAWLHWLPMVWGDYWILHIDRDYQHALVGTPDRQHLWLLARTPDIERPVLQQLVEFAQAEGFDVERLRRTPQVW